MKKFFDWDFVLGCFFLIGCFVISCSLIHYSYVLDDNPNWVNDVMRWVGYAGAAVFPGVFVHMLGDIFTDDAAEAEEEL